MPAPRGGEPADTMRALEREVMLQLIDQKWREHLSEMDYLREGINLRAMGQQDPLVAWQRDGYEMFGQMMSGIDDDYVKIVMHAQVQVLEQAPARRGKRRWPAPSTRRPTTRWRATPACSGRWRPVRPPARRWSSPPAANGRPRRPADGGRGGEADRARLGLRPGGPQRSVPVRERQEVQVLPRALSVPRRA